MSLEKITKALAEIDQSGLKRPYLDPKFSVSEQEVLIAEHRIGFKFPKSYRAFLRAVGSGDFQAVEFYGLIPNQLDLNEIPNAVWFTEDLQNSYSLPKELFAFQDFDGDAVACLFLSKMDDEECPVVLWDHGEAADIQMKKPYILASSFGEYFSEKIRELIRDASE
ncbi:SMI1/KNR4 family protein [Terasakiella pusilla]|uniref:SMI1/KNR4 family protein n=1 Tax=Terasakiella pusilla TaxID=64973 RepID=UPI003AA93432